MTQRKVTRNGNNNKTKTGKKTQIREVFDILRKMFLETVLDLATILVYQPIKGKISCTD